MDSDQQDRRGGEDGQHFILLTECLLQGVRHAQTLKRRGKRGQRQRRADDENGVCDPCAQKES